MRAAGLSRVISFATLCLIAAISEQAIAANHISFRECPTCSSVGSFVVDLRTSGLVSSLPVGTVVLSSSDAHPISAFLEIVWDPRGAKKARALTGNLGMIELDNALYAKATEIPRIEVPSSYGSGAGSANWEIVQGYVLSQLVFPGTPGSSGVSFWHGLFNGFDSSHYMDFTDTRSGLVHRVWTQDKITVEFADGSTAQLKLIGIGAPSGNFFIFVPGSERDSNGDPLVPFGPGVGSVPGSGSGSMALNPPTPWGLGRSLNISFEQSSCTAEVTACDSIGCITRRIRLSTGC